jgi:hypothetical protein
MEAYTDTNVLSYIMPLQRYLEFFSSFLHKVRGGSKFPISRVKIGLRLNLKYMEGKSLLIVNLIWKTTD